MALNILYEDPSDLEEKSVYFLSNCIHTKKDNLKKVFKTFTMTRSQGALKMCTHILYLLRGFGGNPEIH